MTWNEFKAEVDRQLSESGMSGNEELEYIDVKCDMPSEDEEIFITVESGGSISIID